MLPVIVAGRSLSEFCAKMQSYEGLGDAENLVLQINGLVFGYAPVLTADLVLDGVNKVFTVGGSNVTSQVVWEDFPYLLPGENTLKLSVAGVVVSKKSAEIVYTPTYL